MIILSIGEFSAGQQMSEYQHDPDSLGLPTDNTQDRSDDNPGQPEADDDLSVLSDFITCFTDVDGLEETRCMFSEGFTTCFTSYDISESLGEQLVLTSYNRSLGQS